MVTNRNPSSVNIKLHCGSWKPCQGDSLNLPDHRFIRWWRHLIPAELNSQLHAHTQDLKPAHGDENRLEQGDAYLSVIVEVSCDLRGLQGFIEGHTAKGVGLRVADSYTGNHCKDTPLGTFQRFLASKDTRWIKAMQKEIQALEDINTWKLCSLPTNKSAIGCKCAFKIIYLADGSIKRYRSRLVAKGFTQKEGIDYKETFAPVANIVTVKAFLAIIVSHNWIVENLDINDAFLRRDLNEEVYMKVPQGYSKELPPNTAGVLNDKPTITPLDPSVSLNNKDGVPLQNTS
ncbi:retrovirus-related pol polyprotein from transposon TNT 1-94 [Tanacetum coccineum]